MTLSTNSTQGGGEVVSSSSSSSSKTSSSKITSTKVAVAAAAATSIKPSSNWMALQKSLPKEIKDISKNKARKLRLSDERKKDGRIGESSISSSIVSRNNTESFDASSSTPFPRTSSHLSSSIPSSLSSPPILISPGVAFLDPPSNSPQVRELRGMIAGLNVVGDSKRLPGNYLAIDCEMVGLGPLGSESSLARVSIVNYHGHTILDTFVLQRERVTDWRTWVSGVSPKDMESAESFEVVQKKVAELVRGKVLVGHAVHNDTQALLLSHPAPLTRDTQTFPKLREAAKSKRPGLKKLTEILLGVKIQSGGHSSVTDARATMALYRMFKGEWESIVRRQTEAFTSRTKGASMTTNSSSNKRKSTDVSPDDDDDSAEGEEGDQHASSRGRAGKKAKQENFPGGGRKNVSSGLSVIVRRNGVRIDPPGKARARRAGEVGSGAVTAVTSGGGGGGGDSGPVGNWWE